MERRRVESQRSGTWKRVCNLEPGLRATPGSKKGGSSSSTSLLSVPASFRNRWPQPFRYPVFESETQLIGHGERTRAVISIVLSVASVRRLKTRYSEIDRVTELYRQSGRNLF